MAKFVQIQLFWGLFLLFWERHWLTCDAVSVLAVLPSVWKSHYLFGRHLVQQLIDQRNYSAVIVSPHAREDAQLENLEEIRIEGLLENWLEMGLSFEADEMREQSVMERFTRLVYASTSNVDMLLSDPKVRRLLRGSVKFDLLIVDLFLGDALLGIAFHYQIPVVVISPSGTNTWLNQIFGNPQNAALDPSNFLSYNEYMDIGQRCLNTLMALFEKLTYSFFHMISQQAVYSKHFLPLCQLSNRTDLPHHSDLTQNLSLVLMNTHPVLQYPRAYLPNMLSVAGLHLSGTDTQLPNHLKGFLEKAPNGVVLMSLGANDVRLSEEKFSVFLDVFETLSEMHFLVKYNVSALAQSTLPANVMVLPWLPQKAILAHGSVKIFISTCGLMSITEAINTLTPILAMPLLPPQVATARRLRDRGVAYIVPYEDVSYDTLLVALHHLATDDSYVMRLREMRQYLWFDMGNSTPLAKTMHAIDLVLHTRGAAYLRTHVHHLNFLRSNLVDVLAILALSLIAIVAVPFLLISCLLRKSYQNQMKLMLKARKVRLLGTAQSPEDSEDLGTVQRRKRSATISSSSDEIDACYNCGKHTAPETEHDQTVSMKTHCSSAGSSLSSPLTSSTAAVAT